MIFKKTLITLCIIIVFINIALFYANQSLGVLEFCLEYQLPSLSLLIGIQTFIQYNSNKSNFLKLLTTVILSNLISIGLTILISDKYIDGGSVSKCFLSLMDIIYKITNNYDIAIITASCMRLLLIFSISCLFSYCIQYYTIKILKLYTDEKQLSYLTFKTNLLSYFVLYVAVLSYMILRSYYTQ